VAAMAAGAMVFKDKGTQSFSGKPNRNLVSKVFISKKLK
jgi:hypothetical protein